MGRVNQQGSEALNAKRNAMAKKSPAGGFAAGAKKQNGAGRKSLAAKKHAIVAPKLATTDAPKAKHKSKPGALALRNMKKYRKATSIKLLRCQPFQNLIKAHLPKTALAEEIRFQPSALKVLQESFEAAWTRMLEDALLIAKRCKRVTVDANDVRVGFMIANDIDLPEFGVPADADAVEADTTVKTKAR
jgi:histone H3/H4